MTADIPGAGRGDVAGGMPAAEAVGTDVSGGVSGGVETSAAAGAGAANATDVATTGPPAPGDGPTAVGQFGGGAQTPEVAPPGRSSEPAAVTRPVAGLVAAWCALAVGIAAKDGRYGGWAMSAVLVGWGVAAVTVALLGGSQGPASWLGRPVRLAARRLGRSTPWLSWRVTWAAVALVVGLGPVLRHPRYYGSGGFAELADWCSIAAGLLAAAGVAAGLLAARPEPWPPAPTWGLGALRGHRVFDAVVALAAAAGVATVLAAPDPQIDVFHLLQASARGLPDGVNMYHQVWLTGRPGDLHGGLVDVYPYLPATSVLLAPFRLLLGDVRYGLLAALVVAVYAVRALGRREAPWVPVVPLLVLVFPESCYALEQSWTEPLLVACLAVMVWAACGGRGVLAVVAFAVALASKQHVVLLVPVAAAWPAFGRRRAAAACGLGLAFVAPWVLDDPGAFFHDAVRTNLGYSVLDHSLSVTGWAHHFGVNLGFGTTAVALVAAYLLAWRARGDAAGFSAGGALVLLTVVELNKQSFFNHYTLPMALLVLAIATTLAPPRPATEPTQASP
ncbi:glycosyltransferase [Pseudofrankia sp. BMG5.37]|uniref:glycosyltransferase n=1 Tax=Pseudofrankia sp. BMG5.37 TaxID=3050035 RepID=UPI0028962AA9|nr:glycosyltransferase [Pseudofrankia sp. BMG5.37]MDT3444724.1 glycosyltransferase [Pseudofrankia sp. BMG5.37]